MSDFVLFCDHASNRIPPELDNLGLSASEVERHIAWDIGAAGVTAALSKLLNAPAVYSEVSRLVIDCNRHLDANDLIPEVSDGTAIPGNHKLSPADRATRIERWFHSYHNAVEAVLATKSQPVTISVHSMTPSLAGQHRPWQISLSSYTDRSITEPLLEALRAPGDATIGDNQPYDLDPAVDYSTPYHALRRGLRHIQVEFRQDEITTAECQGVWAERFANALAKALNLTFQKT